MLEVPLNNKMMRMLMPHQYHEQCRVLVTSNFDVSECELLFHFHYHIFKQRGL